MVTKCANCDCADASQCTKQEEPEMLDEIVVVANPQDGSNYEGESLTTDGALGWGIVGGGGNGGKGGNGDNNDDQCSWSFPTAPEEIAAALTANEEIATKTGKMLEKQAKDKLAKFNQENPRSYEQAKAIFERQMRQEWKKLKPDDIAAVNNALDIAEFNRLAQEAKTFSTFFKSVNHISDAAEVVNAYNYGIEHDDWTKLFDTSTAIGINAAVGFGLGLLTPVSIPAIIGIGLIVAGVSYFVDENQIRELREEYFPDLNKYLKNSKTATNCK